MNSIHLQQNEPLLTVKDVIARFKITRQTLYKWVKSGYFPKPIKFGTFIRWKPETVRAFEDGLLRCA